MPTKQGSGSKPPPKEKASKKAKSLVCKVCEDEVTDQSKTKDSIFCEGMCDGWIHRYCAGLSTTAFLHFQASSEPFICPHCKLLTQGEQLSNMMQVINALQLEIAELKLNNTSAPAIDIPYTEVLQTQVSTEPPRQETRPTTVKSTEDRKFNVVVYGLKECEEGTKRHERLNKDTESAVSALKPTNPNVSDNSIKDCIRLGKYDTKRTRPRPLLVKLSNARDPLLILTNRFKLAATPDISDMTKEERSIESILLKERRRLINLGTDSKTIKIRGKSLLISNKRQGYVENMEFHNIEPLLENNQPIQPIQSDSGDDQPSEPDSN